MDQNTTRCMIKVKPMGLSDSEPQCIVSNTFDPTPNDDYYIIIESMPEYYTWWRIVEVHIPQTGIPKHGLRYKILDKNQVKYMCDVNTEKYFYQDVILQRSYIKGRSIESIAEAFQYVEVIATFNVKQNDEISEREDEVRKIMKILKRWDISRPISYDQQIGGYFDTNNNKTIEEIKKAKIELDEAEKFLLEHPNLREYICDECEYD